MKRWSAGFTPGVAPMELDRYWPEIRNTYSFVLANRTHFGFMALGDVMPVFVMYLIWRAAYQQSAAFGGLSWSEMVTYLFVAHFFRVVTSFNLEGNMAREIREGTVVRDLVKPQAFVMRELFVAWGWLSGFALVSGVPVLLIGLLFLGAALPPLSALPLLAVSLVMSTVISFGISFLCGTCGFWLGTLHGVTAAKRLLIGFAGGALIPLYLFPDWLRAVVQWLPFQAAVHTPTAIYMGKLAGASAWQALAIQAAWAVGLLWAAHRFFDYGVRKVTIQGG